MNQKIQAKDLINVGIFTAIMFVVCMAVAMLGYIPIFIPLLTVFVPIVGGIPFMLFLTKVKKFGLVTIMATLCGIIMGIMGMGMFALATGSGFWSAGRPALKIRRIPQRQKRAFLVTVYFLCGLSETTCRLC